MGLRQKRGMCKKIRSKIDTRGMPGSFAGSKLFSTPIADISGSGFRLRDLSVQGFIPLLADMPPLTPQSTLEHVMIPGSTVDYLSSKE